MMVPGPISDQRGFTLVEVMAAALILAIIVLGAGQLWAVAGARVTDLTIRQKAIFVLNGQMERLSALYQFTAFGAQTFVATTTYGDSDPALPASRLIYRGNTVTFMPTNGDDFVTDAAGFSTAAGLPVFHLQESNSAEDRNFVWVDRDRNLAGRLSWSEANATSEDCPAFDLTGAAEPCREITLYLEYPFRWRDGVPVAPGHTPAVMSLKTIVGRWQ